METHLLPFHLLHNMANHFLLLYFPESWLYCFLFVLTERVCLCVGIRILTYLSSHVEKIYCKAVRFLFSILVSSLLRYYFGSESEHLVVPSGYLFIF